MAQGESSSVEHTDHATQRGWGDCKRTVMHNLENVHNVLTTVQMAGIPSHINGQTTLLHQLDTPHLEVPSNQDCTRHRNTNSPIRHHWASLASL